MKILVGFDGSNAAQDALSLAQQHAAVFKADLHIMRSLLQSPDLSKEDIDNAESGLNQLKISLDLKGMPCETHVSVSYQSPGEDLVQFAKDHGIEEIVVGVRKRSKVGKLMFGSTAQCVILNAPCPVVSVK